MPNHEEGYNDGPEDEPEPDRGIEGNEDTIQHIIPLFLLGFESNNVELIRR